MHMKSQMLVEMNGTAVVLKYIQDNSGIAPTEEHCNQCCGDRCGISLSPCFWCCQDISENGDVRRRCQGVCSASGNEPLSLPCAKVDTLCEEIDRKSTLRVVGIQALQSRQIRSSQPLYWSGRRICRRLERGWGDRHSPHPFPVRLWLVA